ADPQTVTYIYTKDPVQTASVTASYQNTEGDPIAPNVVKNGNVGDPYTTEQKTIPGYALKEIKGDKTGIFKDKAQTITYIYTKAAVLPEPSSQTEQSTIIRYPNSSGDIVNLNHGSSIQPTSKSQALSIEKPSNSKNKSLGQINSNTPVKSNVRYPKTGESKRTSEILSLIGLGVVIAVVSFGKIILNKR
ncbi:MucBP domain-containing protein, partial [Enterococcus sp. CSURQ0835]|uniref:MucBP domain-containing protein n=1 Tax=Enterococcus sp. CSURQ0835 TaxID=2681394 RepID=UPI00190F45F7